MIFNRFSSVLMLGLTLSLLGTKGAYAQTGNGSDITGTNITTSGQAPSITTENAFSFPPEVQAALQQALTFIAQGNFGTREVTVSGSGESLEVSVVPIVNAAGEAVSIRFANGGLLGNLIASGIDGPIASPVLTPDANNQIAVSQLTGLPSNPLNDAILSFLNTDAASLDFAIVSQAIDLAVALQALGSGQLITPSQLSELVSLYNQMITMAKEKSETDQLGTGLYGVYAVISDIVNTVTTALNQS